MYRVLSFNHLQCICSTKDTVNGTELREHV